jgi:hypothetical protein
MVAAEVAAVILGVFVVAALAAVVDALRHPNDEWDRAEQQRSTWIAVLLVLPVTAPVYWFSIRRQLLTPA